MTIVWRGYDYIVIIIIILKNAEKPREWLASFERYFKYFLGFCLTVFWKAFRKTHNNNLAGINTTTVRHVVIKQEQERTA